MRADVRQCNRRHDASLIVVHTDGAKSRLVPNGRKAASRIDEKSRLETSPVVEFKLRPGPRAFIGWENCADHLCRPDEVETTRVFVALSQL